MSLVPVDGKDRLRYNAWFIGLGEEKTIGCTRVSMSRDRELCIQVLSNRDVSTRVESIHNMQYVFEGAIGCYLCEKNDVLAMIGVSYHRRTEYYKVLQ